MSYVKNPVKPFSSNNFERFIYEGQIFCSRFSIMSLEKSSDWDVFLKKLWMQLCVQIGVFSLIGKYNTTYVLTFLKYWYGNLSVCLPFSISVSRSKTEKLDFDFSIIQFKLAWHLLEHYIFNNWKCLSRLMLGPWNIVATTLSKRLRKKISPHLSLSFAHLCPWVEFQLSKELKGAAGQTSWPREWTFASMLLISHNSK